MRPWDGVIDAYRSELPVDDETPVVTLQEGNTPLIPAGRVSEAVGRDVYLKFEGTNPTCSFKDRGMTLAVSKALEEGARAVACASTGNTSASAAAYAARAGIECIVVLPAGNVAAGKLAQAIVHGARVIPVDGNFDQALGLVRELTADHPAVLVNSLNPYRIVGQQTAAWEVMDRLERAPAAHALPVGNAGNITATWMGYTARSARPQMWGFQAAGAAPIVEGAPVERPETVATAIRIGNPASWEGARAALDESGGSIHAVTDDQILAAQRMLAEQEGVFCEPASAAAVAGILAHGGGLPDGPVVCTLTGHGLKDTPTALGGRAVPAPISATMGALLASLGW